MNKVLSDVQVENLRYRLYHQLDRENLKWKKERIEIYINEIIEKLGPPNKCFFDDEYCHYRDDHLIRVQLGHIRSHHNKGTITDINNLIWICSRHNWMMNTRNLKELKLMIDSILKNYGNKF